MRLKEGMRVRYCASQVRGTIHAVFAISKSSGPYLKVRWDDGQWSNALHYSDVEVVTGLDVILEMA